MVLLTTIFDPIAWTGFEKSLRGLWLWNDCLGHLGEWTAVAS